MSILILIRWTNFNCVKHFSQKTFCSIFPEYFYFGDTFLFPKEERSFIRNLTTYDLTDMSRLSLKFTSLIEKSYVIRNMVTIYTGCSIDTLSKYLINKWTFFDYVSWNQWISIFYSMQRPSASSPIRLLSWVLGAMNGIQKIRMWLYGDCSTAYYNSLESPDYRQKLG